MILSILIKNRDYFATELWRKRQEIKHLESMLEETENELREQCKHNWVTDYVDHKSGEQSNKIIYCEHCNISLKQQTSNKN